MRALKDMKEKSQIVIEKEIASAYNTEQADPVLVFENGILA